MPGVPQGSLKQRLAARRNAWKHGRRARIGGLEAHYGISSRQVKARAKEMAAASPDLNVEALPALALMRLLREAILADIWTRGVTIEVPVVQDGRTIGTHLESNPAIEHLIALDKPSAQFFERVRQAREERRQTRMENELEEHRALIESARAFDSERRSATRCPDVSRDLDRPPR